jgi:anti-sigma factor RsiW
MQCREFRELADSYLGGELLVETNHEVLTHLGACAVCRRELAARRELRARLRDSFGRAPELQPTEEFAAALRARLRPAADHAAPPVYTRPAWLALAACLALAGVAALAFVVTRERTAAPASAGRGPVSDVARPDNTAAPLTPGDALPLVAASLSESAAGDHRDCALRHSLEEKPVPLAEEGRARNPAYLRLVAEALPAEFLRAHGLELVGAHACVFQGRRFAHVILKSRGRTVSLLITKVEHAPDDATRARAGDAPKGGPRDATAGPHVNACPPAGGFNIFCFETRRHAVFVVSDLAEAETRAVAVALAPPVHAHVAKAEQPA